MTFIGIGKVPDILMLDANRYHDYNMCTLAKEFVLNPSVVLFWLLKKFQLKLMLRESMIELMLQHLIEKFMG
jgi:hypothetical protein